MEFVLVLPVLAVMLFGTIDIGRLLHDYHAVSKSVRDATRYLARSDGSSAALNIDCATQTVTQGSAPALNAKWLAMTGTTDGSGSFVLPYWTDPSKIRIYLDCQPNDGSLNANGTINTFQGFYDEFPLVPAVVMEADVSFRFLNAWVLGRDDTLTFTIRHVEPHIGE